MLESLRKEDFEALVGRTLKVTTDASSTELELAEARELKSPSPRATPPFRLILRSRSGWRAAQGMFRVEHPTLDVIEMFAVPIGPDAVGLCYEVVFN